MNTIKIRRSGELAETNRERCILTADTLFNQCHTSAPNLGQNTKQLLLAAINLVVTHGDCYNTWLAHSLSTVIGAEVPIPTAKAIGIFLGEQGIIEKRSTPIQYMDEETGEIMESKTFFITEGTERFRNSFEAVPKSTLTTDPIKKGPKAKRSSPGLVATASIEKLKNTGFHFVDNVLDILGEAESNLIMSNMDAENPTSTAAIEAAANLYTNWDKVSPLYPNWSLQDTGRATFLGSVSSHASKDVRAALCFAKSETVDWDEILCQLGSNTGGKRSRTENCLLGLSELDNPSTLANKAIMSNPEKAICWIDQSASSYQILAAFMNIPELLRMTNVTGDDVADFHSEVGAHMGLTRTWAKKLSTPIVYGGGTSGVENFHEMKYTPAGQKALQDIEKKFFGLVPVDRFIKPLKALAQAKTNTASRYTWTVSPNDDFIVVLERVSIDSVSVGAVVKNGVPLKMNNGEALPKYTCNLWDTARIDKEALPKALAPLIVHSIEALLMHRVVLAAPFDVTTIHDSFGCHSNHVMDLRRIINTQFKQLLKEDCLNHILGQLRVADRADARTIGDTLKFTAMDPKLVTNPYQFM